MLDGRVPKPVVMGLTVGVLGLAVVVSCGSSASSSTQLPAEAAASVTASNLRVTKVDTREGVLTATFAPEVGSINAEIEVKCKNGDSYKVGTGTNGGGCSTTFVQHGNRSAPYELESVECTDDRTGSRATMSCDRGCTTASGSGSCTRSH